MDHVKKRTLHCFCTAMLILLAMVCMPIVSSASGQKEDDKTATALIPVSCTGINTTESFTYKLVSESKEFQTVESSKITLKDKEKGNFRITYTYPGTYRYTVSQQKGTDSATTYDSTVYTVAVYVTENEKGVMYAEPVVYIRGEDKKKNELSFTNKKEAPKETPGSTPGKTPGKTSGSSKISASAKTGDDTPLVLWCGLMALSGMFAIAVWQGSRRKKRGDWSV